MNQKHAQTEPDPAETTSLKDRDQMSKPRAKPMCKKRIGNIGGVQPLDCAVVLSPPMRAFSIARTGPESIKSEGSEPVLHHAV